MPTCSILFLALCLKRAGGEAENLDKISYGATRDRLRDQCIALYRLLSSRDRISIREISEVLEMHPITVRRWLDSFTLKMDIRIERGIVIIERGRAQHGGAQAPASKCLP